MAKTRQNGINVDDHSITDKCGKPLGTAAIVWVSDTELYHYNCCDIEGWSRECGLRSRDSLLKKDKRTGLGQKRKQKDGKVWCDC